MCVCTRVCSVVSDSLQPQGLQPARLLCPWDSPGKNTGVGCHFLLQGIFLTLVSNPCLLCLLHLQSDSFPLVPSGKSLKLYTTNLTLKSHPPNGFGFLHDTIRVWSTRYLPAQKFIKILFSLWVCIFLESWSIQMTLYWICLCSPVTQKG